MWNVVFVASAEPIVPVYCHDKFDMHQNAIFMIFLILKCIMETSYYLQIKMLVS
jgi:hypothetical protein